MWSSPPGTCQIFVVPYCGTDTLIPCPTSTTVGSPSGNSGWTAAPADRRLWWPYTSVGVEGVSSMVPVETIRPQESLTLRECCTFPLTFPHNDEHLSPKMYSVTTATNAMPTTSIPIPRTRKSRSFLLAYCDRSTLPSTMNDTPTRMTKRREEWALDWRQWNHDHFVLSPSDLSFFLSDICFMLHGRRAKDTRFVVALPTQASAVAPRARWLSSRVLFGDLQACVSSNL